MKYKLNDLINDLSLDLKRYCAMTIPNKEPSVFDKMLVILHSPTLFVILNHRVGFLVDNLYERNYLLHYLLKFFYYIGRYISVVLLKIEIDEATKIGGGFFIANKGNCIIGARKIGKNCIIKENVTIGMGIERTSPVIGDNVIVYANSLVYGNISIEDNVVIEKGTVLNKSVRANSIVIGNPAKVFNNVS